MKSYTIIAEDCTTIIKLLKDRNYSCSTIDGMMDAIKDFWYNDMPDSAETPDITAHDMMMYEGEACKRRNSSHG